ncbi:MAG: hypothetical protein JW737_04580 [Acidobacteria bacterium]|nr:hypothetical protein [Acidobacteriota bacterium]
MEKRKIRRCFNKGGMLEYFYEDGTKIETSSRCIDDMTSLLWEKMNAYFNLLEAKCENDESSLFIDGILDLGWEIMDNEKREIERALKYADNNFFSLDFIYRIPDWDDPFDDEELIDVLLTFKRIPVIISNDRMGELTTSCLSMYPPRLKGVKGTQLETMVR